MSKDPLAIYIHDHLAGAEGAIEVLEDMRDQHTGEPLGDFAADLLSEILDDRAQLETLADRLGEDFSKAKEVIARLGSKLSRVKLGRSIAGDFGVFQALELVAIGIHGKLALWRALAAVSESDARLQGMDFDRLSRRAIEQHSKVEERRLLRARSVFSAGEPALPYPQ